MRKFALIIFATSLLCLTFLTACNNKKESVYQDGTYNAEFENYDSRNYKDTLEVTVKNGKVSSLVYDAVNPEGLLKTKDEKMKDEMEAVQATYPEKVSTDLVNQFLEAKTIDEVDVLAGATYSSECFTSLFKALERNMQTGDATKVIIDNVAEK